MLKDIARSKKTSLWVFIPLLVSLFLFFPAKRQISLPYDGTWYRGVAFNIAQGEGLTGFNGHPIDTRPLFPVFIAIAYKLFGVSTASAFVAARVFFVGNILLLYFVGEKFYGRWVGLTSSLLALTSVSINVWSTYIHLDHILPVFMILTMLLTFQAFETQRYIWFGLAGMVLGFGYLLKEMAILFFPLPFLAFIWIHTYRQKRNRLGLAIFGIIFGIIILPWISYVYSISDTVNRAAGGGGVALVMGHLSSPLNNISSLPSLAIEVLQTYYRQNVQINFILAPLFVISWGFILFQAIRQNKKDSKFFAIAFLLFSPIIVFQGLVGFRDRQSLLLFLLSFIALGHCLISIGRFSETLLRKYISNRSVNHTVGRGLTAFLVIVSIGVQTGFDSTPTGTMSQFLDNFNTAKFVAQQNTNWTFVQEPIEQNAKSAGEWFSRHAAPGARVLAGDQLLPSTYFYAKGDILFYNLPDDDIDSLLSRPDISWHNQNLLYLWLRKPPWVLPLETPLNEQYRLHVLLEDRFINELKKHSINYVMLDRSWNFLTLYLLDHPGFYKVAEFQQGTVTIFEVADMTSHRFETHVDSQAIPFLETLQRETPGRYRQITNSFFVDGLGWTSDQLNDLLDEKLPIFTLNNLVTLEDYAALRSRYGSSGISQAIIQHQKATQIRPDNPWPYLTLGILYKANGDLDNSMKAYEQALHLDPDNLTALLDLLKLQVEIIQTSQESQKTEILSGLAEQILAAQPDNQEVISQVLTAYKTVTEAYQSQDNLPLAVATYEEASNRLPQVVELKIDLARLYQQQGRWDKATATYETILKLEPDPTFILRAYLGLAEVASQAGDPNKALNHYQTALAAFPETPEIYFRMGLFYESQGAWSEAIAAYEQARHMEPTERWINAQGLYQLGHLYYQQNQPEKAIAVYEQSLSWQPKLQAYLELAELYQAEGNSEKMIITLQKAVTAFPNRPAARLALAEAYEQDGLLDEAVAEYQQVLTLTSPNWMFDKAQDRLEALLAQGGQN